MNDDPEIKELLREIRDLQKAHFEQYKRFTQRVIEDQQRAAEQAARFQAEDQQYRLEMRHLAEQSHSVAHRAQKSLIVSGVMFALLLLMHMGVFAVLQIFWSGLDKSMP